MSSHELGEHAGVSPALVRKDLAWFGEFGKQGVGYEVAFLRDELRRILNLDREIRVALIGVGSLGSALVRYQHRRYTEEPGFNLHLVALFDSDPNKVGARVGPLQIHRLDDLESLAPALGIQMAIITVPAENAQEVAEACARAHIKALLNFAPTKVIVPADTHIAHADVSLEMQRLAYYLDGADEG